MKFKFLNQSILFFSIIFMFSCSVEEEENIELTSNGEEVLYQRNAQVKNVKMVPLAFSSIYACGEGFKVNITFNGFSAGATQYYYEVWNAGGTQFINSGNVSDGMNTDWVLAPCTVYTFKFWGTFGEPGPPFAPSQILTATSDGCGGFFIC